jgi:hypothetical protein
MCSMPLEANSLATWFPMPGPAPNRMRVRAMVEWMGRIAMVLRLWNTA